MSINLEDWVSPEFGLRLVDMGGRHAMIPSVSPHLRHVVN